MARWLAAGVVSRVFEDGIRRWIVLDTKMIDREGAKLQTKFPAGTEQFHEAEDKNVLGTLRREYPEETDLTLREGLYPFLLHSNLTVDHFQNFYDIDYADCEGTLRTVEKIVDGDWMSPPYWVTFEEGCRLLHNTHQPALLKSEARHRPKEVAA